MTEIGVRSCRSAGRCARRCYCAPLIHKLLRVESTMRVRTLRRFVWGVMEAGDDIRAEVGKSHQGPFQSQRHGEQLWPEVAPCASIRRPGRSQSDQASAEVLETPLSANGREDPSGSVMDDLIAGMRVAQRLHRNIEASSMHMSPPTPT
jgi:hypothetical protein